MGSSSNTANDEKEEKGFTKVCYYEILSIERSATDKEINKAYKKSSLKWHPDKNKDKDTT